MRTWKLIRGSAALCATLAAVLAIGPATASAKDACAAPDSSQPFLSYGDSAWYTIVPGQSHDYFTGKGWTLSGGATLTSATIATGATAQVLKLPANGKAVSPAMCVNNLYPYMRSMISSTDSASIKVYVSYLGPNGWGTPKTTGTLTTSSSTWALSNKAKLVTGPISGWQYAQFTLVGAGSKATSNARIYNLYADPKMRR